MKVKVKFPINAKNRKEIREQLLLDTAGSGVEKALFNAANSAKTADQKVFVNRGYGPKGRLSVWIVDDTGSGNIRNRMKALKEALARVKI